ncbi:hypothetical protein DBR39_04195 [Chryseobacterium sp. KBW03]|nr:hypothetical protein DBR39_04195 [Chryseobacterium sp. KBW03]
MDLLKPVSDLFLSIKLTCVCFIPERYAILKPKEVKGEFTQFKPSLFTFEDIKWRAFEMLFM